MAGVGVEGGDVGEGLRAEGLLGLRPEQPLEVEVRAVPRGRRAPQQEGGRKEGGSTGGGGRCGGMTPSSLLQRPPAGEIGAWEWGRRRTGEIFTFTVKVVLFCDGEMAANIAAPPPAHTIVVFLAVRRGKCPPPRLAVTKNEAGVGRVR